MEFPPHSTTSYSFPTRGWLLKQSTFVSDRGGLERGGEGTLCQEKFATDGEKVIVGCFWPFIANFIVWLLLAIFRDCCHFLIHLALCQAILRHLRPLKKHFEYFEIDFGGY